MDKILIPIDGSENSNKALLKAQKYADCLGADIVILNVVNTVSAKPYNMEQDYTVQKNNSLLVNGRKLLRDAANKFGNFSGKVKTIQKTGEPADTIIQEIEDGAYGLVIMGSRGLGGFSRVMLGSVSDKILNSVSTSVLIIK